MRKNNNILVSPILKWVGGKRQLLPEINPLIPQNHSTYVEPFVGGGAVVFDLQPKQAIINDSNAELINVYRIVKDSPDLLIESLMEHEKNNDEDYFYDVRALDRTPGYQELSDVEKASRILYLNKTCYNGLYRVNSSGQFNSPYGKYKKPNITNATTIKAVSKFLNNNQVDIKCGDYKDVLSKVNKGSFVYLDPPYMPISSSSSFTGYTDIGFSYERQLELRDECNKLKEKNIPFLLSNSDCEEIRDLYSGYEIKTVYAKRNINSKANLRGDVKEVLVYYDPKNDRIK